MGNPPKTLEEHREYLYQIVRLKLWYLHFYLENHPEESFSFVLRNRVDIFRKTDLNPEGFNPQQNYFEEPAWLAFEAELLNIYEQFAKERSGFEEAGFAFCRPHLDARLERDFADRSGFQENQCGFLRVNRAPASRPGMSPVHISNNRAPDSFFDDPAYMKQCFLDACDAAEGFGSVEVSSETWLNQVPKWLAWFPQEWLDNRREPNTDVRWHYGFWGQFINGRGCFNARAGEYLRRTGKLPYYPVFSHCTVAALRKHLLEKD